MKFERAVGSKYNLCDINSIVAGLDFLAVCSSAWRVAWKRVVWQ